MCVLLLTFLWRRGLKGGGESSSSESETSESEEYEMRGGSAGSSESESEESFESEESNEITGFMGWGDLNSWVLIRRRSSLARDRCSYMCRSSYIFMEVRGRSSEGLSML